MRRAAICPPSRRGHSWRELLCKVPPSEGGPTIRDLVEARVCARCGAHGRVNKQGLIDVVDPEPERLS